MAVGADIANYWLYDPETVTVTYTKKDGTTSVATAKAKIVERDYREMQMGAPVGLEPEDQIWAIGIATLGGLEFERGGTITEAGGTVWMILMFRPRYAGAAVESYRAVCRKRL